MKIIIEFIKPEEQKYPTCGNYFQDKNDDWNIQVSQMDDTRSMWAVSQHELYELGQVLHAQIPIEKIDAFDINYETNRKPGDDSEPGDSYKAPYFEQHQMATVVERIYCQQSGLSWKEHEQNVLRSLA